MCSIAGWVACDRDLIGPETEGIFIFMTKSVSGRGPDAEGFWRGGHVLLGHQRLAVIDIERGAQL